MINSFFHMAFINSVVALRYAYICVLYASSYVRSPCATRDGSRALAYPRKSTRSCDKLHSFTS
jgi:hypothetical protein